MSTLATREPPPSVGYRFGGSTNGIWLGLGTTRMGLLSAGLLVSILAMTAGAPLPLAVLPVLTGVALAGARAAGRPLLDWIGPAVSHGAAVTAGERGWCAPLPALTPNGLTPGARRLQLPAEFGRPRVIDCGGERSIGAVADTPARTLTVVFDVAGVDRFPLLDGHDQEALLGGWAAALAVLADTDDALTRLQLIDRATCPGPADLAAPAELPQHEGADGGPVALDGWLDALATVRTCRLAVQWTFGRLDTKAIGSLATRCQAVSRSLLTAHLLTRPLDRSELADDLTGALRIRSYTEGARWGGPVSRRTEWSHVRVEDTVHRSYAVSRWPACAVGADWLDPLLLAAPPEVTRTVAIHLERVAPAAAARVARTTRAKAMLDRRDRARLGMTSSAAIDAAEISGVEMDAELAAGYRTHRVTALITLSGASTASLDDAARIVRQAAAAARLDLQPVHGQHDRALAATLPLCRLRTRGQA